MERTPPFTVLHGVRAEPGRHVVPYVLLVLIACIALNPGKPINVGKGEGLEHRLLAAPVRNETFASDPSGRPLLAVRLHEVTELLRRLEVIEDLRLPLAIPGTRCAPADDVRGLPTPSLFGFDVGHATTVQRHDVPTRKSKNPLRLAFPQVRGGIEEWSLGESNP
jgi:hypothetical protein